MLRYIDNLLWCDNMNSLGFKTTDKSKKVLLIDLGGKWMKMANLLKERTDGFYFDYVAIRPIENEYDRKYYDDHIEQYEKVSAEYTENGRKFLPVLTGLVQDYEKELEQYELEYDLLVFNLNDVHYYLSNWKPTVHGLVMISGGQFSTVMGTRILLPFGQGWYSHLPKYEQGKNLVETEIVMNSSGTNQMYTHDFNYIKNADKVVSYGYYQHFRKMTDTDHWAENIYKLEVPSDVYVIGNPQKALHSQNVEIMMKDLNSAHCFSKEPAYKIRGRSMFSDCKKYIFSTIICMLIFSIFSASMWSFIPAFAVFMLSLINGHYRNKVRTQSWNTFVTEISGNNIEYENTYSFV